MIFLAMMIFIFVHAAGGEEMGINVEEISSVRQIKHEKGEKDPWYHENVNCVIVMSNGKFIGVAERCLDVIHLIAESDKAYREN